jgi:hypothetical protein
MGKHHEPIEEKLKRLSKLDPDTGCLIWTGPKGGRGGEGDGEIPVPGKGNQSAHIAAWEFINGLRPEGFKIYRTCGNKLCIAVQHMFLFKASAIENNIEGQLDHLKRRIIVNSITGCWEWQGAKSKGYGRLQIGKRQVSAHCLMWKCTHGETNGLHVLHRCDNPCCVNPVHLYLGTHAENMRDKVNKSRTASKLNADAVRDIRTSKLSPKELAEKYKVNISIIYGVLSRRTWKHIE